MRNEIHLKNISDNYHPGSEWFSITQIKEFCQIKYNDAMLVFDMGLQNGIFERKHDQNHCIRFFSPKPNTQASL